MSRKLGIDQIDDQAGEASLRAMKRKPETAFCRILGLGELGKQDWVLQRARNIQEHKLYVNSEVLL